jgi:hypothetical protein
MDFGDILRGVGGFAANELLGVDDFRRTYKYAKQGDWGKALKSAGAGVFELGSTFIPAGRIVKGGRLGRTILQSSPFGGQIVSRLPGFADDAGRLTQFGSRGLNAFRTAETGQNIYKTYKGFQEGNASPNQPMSLGTVAPRTATTGQTGGYVTSPYGAMPVRSTTGQTASGTGSTTGSTGGSTATGGGTGSTTDNPATAPTPPGGLAEADAAAKAIYDTALATAQKNLDTYNASIDMARREGSTVDQEALRQLARATQGGTIDTAGMLGELGFGMSPATLGMAIDQYRQREALGRSNILSRIMDRTARLGRESTGALSAYEAALINAENNLLVNRVGRTISQLQPYLGGI